MKKVLMVLSLFVLFSCENESEQSDFDYDRHNDKVLSVAKQVWKEAKPVVSADVQGAAEGVATALATGPTGAGAAAVIGACVSSAGKCIERIINTKEN